MRIADAFVDDFTQAINPVIKIGDQADQAQLAGEISSYIITPVLEEYLDHFLTHYVDTRQRDTDLIGAWLYGFVGSGKSHFAKVVGLLLANRILQGQTAIEWFRPRIQLCRRRQHIEEALLQIKNFFTTEVIPFHINAEANQRVPDENICQIFHRMFLRHLGLSEDTRIAAVEQTLIRAEKYDAFRKDVQDKTGCSWEDVRRPGEWDLYRQDIFAALAKVLPSAYSSPSDAQQAFESRLDVLTFGELAKRLAEHVDRRSKAEPGRTHRLIFMVDELGAFIADSGRKLHDVGTLAEELARYGKGRVWLFATGHDNLQALCENARQRRVDLLWLEGRFHRECQFKLTAENIGQVLEERLLKKKQQGKDELSRVFDSRTGTITDLAGFQNCTRAFPPFDRDQFVASYPFRHYQMILVPDIVKILRTAGGRPEVLTGGTRSLLGIVQGVLTREENGYVGGDIGRVVPLDHIYFELEHMEVPQEVRTEISQIVEMPDQLISRRRVLRALYLLQQAEYIPTTPRNVSLSMAEDVSDNLTALEGAVAKALDSLVTEGFVVETGGTYRYVSGDDRDDARRIADEKASVRTPDRVDYLKQYFLNSTYLPSGQLKYENAFDFDIRVTCDGQTIHSRGDLELRMSSALQAELGHARVEDAEIESAKTENQNIIFWISAKSSKIERGLTDFIGTLKAMGPVVADPAQSPERKNKAQRYLDEIERYSKPSIGSELSKGLLDGHIVFRGSSHPVSSPGQKMEDVFVREVSALVPKVYTQFSRGKYRVTNEQRTIESICRAQANRLAQVEPGLRLFDANGDLQRTTPIVADILGEVSQRTAKGERPTGKEVCAKFSSIPFGWDVNLVRVVMAAAFRTSTIALKLENREYRDYRIAEAQNLLRDSRKFNNCEIVWEADTPPTPAEVQKARELVHLVFGEQPAETPAAITEVLQKKIGERLGEHEKVLIWVQTSSFPASQDFLASPEVLKNLLLNPRPNAVVKKLLEKAEDVTKKVAATKSLRDFFESDRKQQFGELKEFLGLGRFVKDKDSVGHPKTVDALDSVGSHINNCTLAQSFPPLWGKILDARSELSITFDKRKQEFLQALDKARVRLVGMARDRQIPEDKTATLFAPLDGKRNVIANLAFQTPGGYSLRDVWNYRQDADDLEDKLAAVVNQFVVAPPQPPGPPQPPEPPKPPKPPRHIRIRDLPDVPRVIRSQPELGKAIDSIRKAAEAALDLGEEVTLG